MKPKRKWSLRISASMVMADVSPSTSKTTPDEKRKYPRHLSMHHEKELKKKRDEKKAEIQRAVDYCRANNCRGYKAIKDLDLKLCKDPRTINSHLEKEIIPGGEVRILTDHEEKTLVKYLINRNRACQGLNDQQIADVVLNILRVRQKRNRERKKGVGNWYKHIPLSVNAKKALANKKISRSFFRRFRAAHPEVKPKSQHKVSLKRGLRCTREMAIDYLDALARLLIDVNIAPDLRQTAPGVWEGEVDLTRIWAHDETPQFINFNASGQSRKKVYAGSGHDCTKLSKENLESVTVQPFSNFAGELAMVQVIFAGAGMTSHMCPEIAVEKIPNLLISVNESGCSTGDTLCSAYKQLSETIIARREAKGKKDDVHVVIADGHKSRFDAQVLSLCEENTMDQFILWPDTSGATQKHDQINSLLHAKYEEVKSMMYTEYSDLNKECFMNILSDVIKDWATPEKLGCTWLFARNRYQKACCPERRRR